MSREAISGYWAGDFRPEFLEVSGPNVYVGVGNPDNATPSLVAIEDIFKALAKVTGKRITVADVETVVTVKNEVVYYG